jgi:hypothetical protein
VTSAFAFPENELRFSTLSKRASPSVMVLRSLGFAARTVSSAVDERDAVCVPG